MNSCFAAASLKYQKKHINDQAVIQMLYCSYQRFHICISWRTQEISRIPRNIEFKCENLPNKDIDIIYVLNAIVLKNDETINISWLVKDVLAMCWLLTVWLFWNVVTHRVIAPKWLLLDDAHDDDKSSFMLVWISSEVNIPEANIP